MSDCKGDDLHDTMLRIEERLIAIERQGDRNEERVMALERLGERNTVTLEEHVRRTRLLEDLVGPMEKDLTKMKIIGYVALALLSSAGVLGTFGKTLLSLFGGSP